MKRLLGLLTAAITHKANAVGTSVVGGGTAAAYSYLTNFDPLALGIAGFAAVYMAWQAFKKGNRLGNSAITDAVFYFFASFSLAAFGAAPAAEFIIGFFAALQNISDGARQGLTYVCAIAIGLAWPVVWRLLVNKHKNGGQQ